ncbi:MAG TPA: acyltransferase [Burkholderiales bacterium]|nr:acyltransferase [Burkholderiales bacterium]
MDASRGLAALFVVVWHWQHFYDFSAPDFDRSHQPLYSVLLPAYSQGPFAVDLFFCLSGFVFFWLYSEKIVLGRVPARDFFLLRFSRLYPLYVLTLLFVAASFLAFGEFVYRHDAYHFVLNLFLASSVGLEKGLSYNGPSWSISVEFVLYGLFFVGCRWMRSRSLLVLLGMIVGLEMWPIYEPIARGLMSFFAGAAAYLVYRSLSRSAAPAAVAVAALCWLVTMARIYFVESDAPHFLLNVWALLVLFPSTMVALALARPVGAPSIAALRFLGDISYSVYLLHFPLQVIFNQFDLDFDAPWVLGLFFALLIPLSAASHYGFEMPAQRWLRNVLAVPRPVAVPQARS